METVLLQPGKKSKNAGLWTGRIIGVICILFLWMDAVMKIMMNHFHVEGSAKLGWGVEHLQPIGFVLLVCTVLYCVPRTAIVGAILLTGYFGGAVASMFRVDEPFYFPIIMAILVWVSLYLRDAKLRKVTDLVFSR